MSKKQDIKFIGGNPLTTFALIYATITTELSGTYITFILQLYYITKL
jgi:hypothetical protein